MINRWAPAHDNIDPSAYASFVAARVGVRSDGQIDFEDAAIAIPMTAAMIQFDNGMQPYTVRQLEGAHQLALSS